MTTCGVQASGAIEQYFYRELTQSERDRLEQHLAICGPCRDALDVLEVIRAALAVRPAVSAPPAGDWSAFMSRLDDAVKREVAPPASAFHRQASSRRVGSQIRHSVAAYLSMAALLALVTTSVFIVMRSRGATTGSSPAVTVPRAPGQAARDDRAFAALSEEHLERSKLVVLGLATKDAGRTTSAGWTYERRLATSLLSDTRMYRLAAEARGLQMLAGVMRDLELVLLQASLTEETDSGSLAQIQRLIRKRDLLEKMDVVTTAGL
jgi:hypothetical protein